MDDWTKHPATLELIKRLEEERSRLTKDLIDFASVQSAASIEKVGANTVARVAMIDALEIVARYVEELNEDTPDG